MRFVNELSMLGRAGQTQIETIRCSREIEAGRGRNGHHRRREQEHAVGEHSRGRDGDGGDAEGGDDGHPATIRSMYVHLLLLCSKEPAKVPEEADEVNGPSKKKTPRRAACGVSRSDDQSDVASGASRRPLGWSSGCRRGSFGSLNSRRALPSGSKRSKYRMIFVRMTMNAPRAKGRT